MANLPIDELAQTIGATIADGVEGVAFVLVVMRPGDSRLAHATNIQQPEIARAMLVKFIELVDASVDASTQVPR